MKKLLLLSLILLISIPLVYAHCPLCTMAVGTGVVAAKYYGLDTSIIGLLVGAFAVSIGLWIGLKLKKEYIKFQLSLIVLASFLLTIIPIIIGIKSDSIYLPIMFLGTAKVYWIDKLLFGSIIGGLLCLAGYWVHNYIKKSRGKVLFPYQGIAITLFLLLISSVVLYFLPI